MRWLISTYEVTWPSEGSPVLSLHAGDRHIADVRFGDAQGQRFNVDFETDFVTLNLATDDRAALLDHLRHERGVVLDTEAGTLTFRK